MILLQSIDQYQRVARFSPESVSFELAKRSSLAREFKTSGTFCTLGGTFVALYCYKGDISLCVDKTIFPLESIISIDQQKNGKARCLRIEAANRSVELSYSLPEHHPDDPEDGLNEEDMDYGLFLLNMKKDQARQRVLREIAA